MPNTKALAAGDNAFEEDVGTPGPSSLYLVSQFQKMSIIIYYVLTSVMYSNKGPRTPGLEPQQLLGNVINMQHCSLCSEHHFHGSQMCVT